MSEPIHVISLGAGVQSSTMALMAAAGEITPMPKCAIFADTQAEPKSVYIWLDWLEKQLPFPVHRVTAGNLANKTTEVRKSKSGKTYLRSLIPAFVARPDGTPGGLLGRRCTSDFKIVPLTQELRRILGLKQVRSSEPLVFQWIGISLDESLRMKDSRDKWIKHVWPLIDKGMTRKHCLEWMEKMGFPKPPRSACIFCPFHSDEEWSRLTEQELSEVIAFEKRLQTAASQDEVIRGKPFLHSSCNPIGEVNFTSKRPGYAQLSLFNNECEGMCGV